MKKVLHTIILLLACAAFATAQAPWRAKFVVHYMDPASHPDSVIIIDRDTVWFGFDPMGDDGYQEGLDIIDTISENRVYGYDSTFVMQDGNTCKRFRQEIKVFKHYSVFHFESFGPIYYISWDTSDFKYHDSTTHIRLLAAWIRSVDAPINDPDAKFVGFYDYPHRYYTTTAVVWHEGPLTYHSCTKNYNLFRFSVNLIFNLPTGSEYFSKSDGISISVNPYQKKVYIYGLTENDAYTYSIISATGSVLKQGLLASPELSCNELPTGMYILSIMHKSSTYSKKLILIN